MSRVWRFTVFGTDSSGQQEWNSTMHYQTDLHGNFDEPDADTVLTKLRNHYGAGGNGDGMERWLATIPAPVKLTGVRVYEELAPGSTDLPHAAVFPLALVGQSADIDPNLPFALCPFIKFGTALASRSTRGGTHLAPALDQNKLGTNGLFDTTLSWWSAIISLAGYMKDDLQGVFGDVVAGGDLHPVIYSRTRRQRGLSPYTFRLTTAVPSATPRWLRRRDVGR